MFTSSCSGLARRLRDDIDLELIAEATEGRSGAELEGVLLGAASVAAADDRDVITQADLERAVVDVIPSRDTRMLRFMELRRADRPIVY